MKPFTTTRRVEFSQTDAAGIAHFASFFPMMESVEHEFLRHLGLSLMSRDPSGPVSWPRVHAQCDYRGPARFDDVLTINLTISRLGEKSITYQFDIRHDDRPVAEGEVTAVCCRIKPDQPPQSMPIPADIAAKFRSYCS